MPEGHSLMGGQIPSQQRDSTGSAGCPLTVHVGVWRSSLVEHIGLEEIISESVEMLEEAAQKSQKRRE